MSVQPDTHPGIEPIEGMPAAPDANQETRDADAPTWSAPTEGHGALPVGDDADPHSADPDRADPTATARRAAPDAAAEPGSGRLAAIRIEGGGAQRIEGHEVTITQGGAAIIRGDRVTVEQGGAAIVAARRVDFRDGGAFIVLARNVSGDVRAVLDWRAIAAIIVGVIVLSVVRGRR